MIEIIIPIILSYLIGSVPTAILAGKKDNWDVGEFGFALKLLTDPVPVGAGHHDIQENYVRFESASSFNGIIGTVYHLHLVTGLREESLYDFRYFRFVINYKDTGGIDIYLV